MKEKVMIASDGPNFNTGYGKLGRVLTNGLIANGYDVSYVSFQHQGNPLYYIFMNQKVKVYSGLTQQLIEEAVREFKPDVLIHIRDPVVHTEYYKYPYQFDRIRKSTKTIGYLMVMHDYFDSKVMKAIFVNYDIVTTPTEWGRRVLVSSGMPINLVYTVKPWIPRPVKPEKVQGLPDKYLLFIGVNDDKRKNHALLLHVLSRLPEEYKLVLLSSSGAYILESIIERYALYNRVYTPQSYLKGYGLTEEELAYIYLNAHVYVTLSSLEGIDMPALEALTYNTPVVASEIPVHKELLSPYAKFVKVNLGYPDTNGVYWIPDVDDAVEKIMSIGETRHKYGRKVYSAYNVNRAIGDFKQLFNLA